ncbi:MAG: hypothetical protein ACXITR_13460 [Cyanobacterium sp.]
MIVTFLAEKKKTIKNKINKISTNNLLIATSISIGLSIWSSYVRLGELTPLNFILTTVLTIYLLSYFSSKYFKNNWFNNCIRRYGFYPMLWFATFSIWFGDILAFSANAQAGEGSGTNEGIFFRNIRSKITSILGNNAGGDGATQIINFGFGILQLALILYIAFSIFQAVKAQQNDEEWIESAKVPLIVLFAVTAGDFAVSLI